MVLCSVCGVRLGSAIENEGSFQVSKDFGKPITDTCEPCAKTLREAVASAAKKIANRKVKRAK